MNLKTYGNKPSYEMNTLCPLRKNRKAFQNVRIWRLNWMIYFEYWEYKQCSN